MHPNRYQLTSNLQRLQRLKQLLGEVIIETDSGKSYQAVIKSTYRSGLTPLFALADSWKKFLETQPGDGERTITINFPIHALVTEANVVGHTGAVLMTTPLMLHGEVKHIEVALEQTMGVLKIQSILFAHSGGGVLHPNAQTDPSGKQRFCLGDLNNMEGLQNKTLDGKQLLEALIKPNFTGSYRQEFGPYTGGHIGNNPPPVSYKKSGMLYTKASLIGANFSYLLTRLGGHA
jgi:hypothetical protein